MKLTSGFEDFGFGETREACIEDAVASGCITRQQIEEGLAKFERTNVLGKGLYFSEEESKGNEMTKIVWNGSDGYIEADDAVRRGYDFDGAFLYAQEKKFESFSAVEVDPQSLPKDDDGDPDMDGVLGSESGKFYRAA